MNYVRLVDIKCQHISLIRFMQKGDAPKEDKKKLAKRPDLKAITKVFP